MEGAGVGERREARTRDLTFSQAYETLRGAQKSNFGAPAYSRWINRPAGRVLASVAYQLGMTPNQVTAVSALVTYGGVTVIALAEPSTTIALLVALLLLVGYALDSADGQLARLTKMGRPSGEWLDHVIDMGKICLLHGAVAISWFRWGVADLDVGVWAIAIPVLFLTVTVVGFFGWLLSDLLIRVSRAHTVASAEPSSATSPPIQPAASRQAPVLRSVLRLPGDYGLLALTFVLFASSAFALSYTLLMVGNALILIIALPVWFSQVRAAEAKP